HGLMREGWYPVTTIRLVRHRQTKGAATDRPDLRTRDACSLLYQEFLNLKPIVRKLHNSQMPFFRSNPYSQWDFDVIFTLIRYHKAYYILKNNKRLPRKGFFEELFFLPEELQREFLERKKKATDKTPYHKADRTLELQRFWEFLHHE
ncbi:hypothetical protein, partial [Thiocystis minor]|uniref:hypothetical protein n=1 Tax=Thiocystis minor TaxID=61597 RepID=UPI001A933E06